MQIRQFQPGARWDSTIFKGNSFQNIVSLEGQVSFRIFCSMKEYFKTPTNSIMKCYFKVDRQDFEIKVDRQDILCNEENVDGVAADLRHTEENVEQSADEHRLGRIMIVLMKRRISYNLPKVSPKIEKVIFWRFAVCTGNLIWNGFATGTKMRREGSPPLTPRLRRPPGRPPLLCPRSRGRSLLA